MLFTRLLVDLLVWVAAEHPDWDIALDEGRVKTPRECWARGERVSLDDAVHVRGSKHYSGEAADLLLYIGGVYVKDGDSPAWKEIARMWESLHPHATSGRRWNDANHVSLGEGNREGPLP